MDAKEVADKCRNKYQGIYLLLRHSPIIGIALIFHRIRCIAGFNWRKSCNYGSIRLCLINIVLNILKMSTIRILLSSKDHGEVEGYTMAELECTHYSHELYSEHPDNP